MNDSIHPLIIVGAGACGLHLARGFQQLFPGTRPPLIVEKSRGVGGRIATRRDGDLTFDHGAQKLPANCLHRIGDRPFLCYNSDIFPANGMTQVAKLWAEGLRISLNQKATKIIRHQNHWELETESGESYQAQCLAITAPAPQAVELLQQSQLEAPKVLRNIRYAKALVYLIDGETTNPFLERPFHEWNLGDVHTVSDQKSKGTSAKPAWVVVMNTPFSEQYFEESEEALIERGRRTLALNLPDLHIRHITVKKWRYAFPLQPLIGTHLELLPGLYVLGDAFGAGIDGALHSAEGLLNHLKQTLP